MTTATLTEDYLVEQAAINWFKGIEYSYIYGYELSPESDERESYREAILKKRFLRAVKRLNPWLDEGKVEEVYYKVSRLDHPDFLMKSKIFYEMLTQGLKVEITEEGQSKTKLVKMIDVEVPQNNDFLVANQFTIEYQYQKGSFRRPDLVVFVNGLPLAVFEFKGFNASSTARDAFEDHEVKKEDIPQLYVYAQVLVASDGKETKYGSTTSDWDRFFVWEGIFDDADLEEGGEGFYKWKESGKVLTSLEVLIKGLFRKEHFVEFLNDFIVYEKSGESYLKKIAMFHQFYAVRKALNRTKKAVLEGKTREEKRIGVIWHTQGTGKSLTMLFYARKALKEKEFENPLLLFITDRVDLDKQLSHKFANVLPLGKRVDTIKELQQTLKQNVGGIIFATIQKFGTKRSEEYPFLTDRKNIIVIADEAHRSQYKKLAMNLRIAIPNASFIGFTATPIELEDKSTTLVFGSYISVYSLDKAKRHKVIVPIYYEARLAELHLTEEFIDEDFEEDEAVRNRVFRKLEEMILSSEDRLDKIANDIVKHFNNRRREIEGKAMIVTISRRVAAKLYEKIIQVPGCPSVAVVFSGSKNEKELGKYVRNKHELERLADDFKNPEADPKMVIVVDMWLTGFDVPCLHTMYFDRPMKNHSLVQAIARVNRVFKDKPGGLIVDYIGIADNLRKSLAIYTLKTINEIFLDIGEVITYLKEKHDIVSSFFYGINYGNWKNLPNEDLNKLILLAYEKVTVDEENKKKFIKEFVALKKLFALAAPHPEAYRIKDDLRFFEIIKKMIVKYTSAGAKEIARELEYELNQLISKSVAAEEPIDIFSLMGKEKPDISIFDEKFLAQFKDIEYKNYAADVLTKIIKDELNVKLKVNPYRYRSLFEALKRIIEKYNLKILTAAEVIEELIKLATEVKKKVIEGKEFNLTEQELAFYDLLCSKDRYFENYKQIERVAKDIVRELGGYVTLADWNRKEIIKSKIKAALKKILIKVVGESVAYEELDKLSEEIFGQAEQIYRAA